MHKVVARPQANRDVAEIALRIGEESPSAGERFLDAFEYTCQLLAQMPAIGSLCSVMSPKLVGLRAVTITGFRNYVVLFRPHDDQVEVIRVIHGARDLEQIVAQES